MWQESVLLRAVEPVNLVDEQDRVRPAGPFPLGGLRDQLAYAGDTLRDCAERLEPGSGPAGEYRGESRLSTARRSPQDQARDSIALDQFTQRPFPADEPVLSDEFVERAGAHPGRQRGARPGHLYLVGFPPGIGTEQAGCVCHPNIISVHRSHPAPRAR